MNNIIKLIENARIGKVPLTSVIKLRHIRNLNLLLLVLILCQELCQQHNLVESKDLNDYKLSLLLIALLFQGTLHLFSLLCIF